MVLDGAGEKKAIEERCEQVSALLPYPTWFVIDQKWLGNPSYEPSSALEFLVFNVNLFLYR